MKRKYKGMEGVLNTLGSDFVSSQLGKKISFHFVQFFRQALDARVGEDEFWQHQVVDW